MLFYDALGNYIPGYIFNFNSSKSFKQQVKEDKFMGDAEFLNVFFNLVNRRVDSFKWEGLPKTCSERLLEMCLLFNGRVICYEVEEGVYVMLPVVFGPEYNINGDYLRATAYSPNGKVHDNVIIYQQGMEEFDILKDGVMTKVKGDYKGVIGRDNAMCWPFIMSILVKAKQLANRERAMDTVIEGIKQPLILSAPEEQAKAIAEKFQKVRNNEPIIIEHSPLTTSNIEALDTGVKYEALTYLREDYNNIKDSINELMGFNSNPSHKRERSLVDEVNANNDTILSEMDKALLWRKKFCEDCNSAFGLNLSVDFRYKQDQEKEEGMLYEESDDEANENFQPDFNRNA